MLELGRNYLLDNPALTRRGTSANSRFATLRETPI